MPRLSVFRSNTEIYAQLIDDVNGVTLASASSREKDIKAQKATKTEKSKMVGEAIAKKAIAVGLAGCVFDRGGFLYHGRVKAVAEGAREGGLKF
jgi:large subunit ribosomal protein L18